MDQAKIKLAFRMNAAFSGVSGVVGMVFNSSLRRWFDAPSWLFPVLGVGLVLFSLHLLWLARRGEVSRSEAIQVVAADALWVLACVDLVIFSWVTDSRAVALTLGSCIFVGLFALLQLRATVSGAERRPV